MTLIGFGVSGTKVKVPTISKVFILCRDIDHDKWMILNVLGVCGTKGQGHRDLDCDVSF